MRLHFWRAFVDIARVTLLGVGFMGLAACELTEDEDSSSSSSNLRAVDMSCLITDAVGCSTGNDAGTMRVGIVDDCSTFSSSSTIYAVAEGTLDCDVLGCTLTSAIQPTDFAPTSVTAGTYDLYAFIDEDDDDLPDTLTEPIGCYQDVVIDGTSTEITITDWN